ncbi:MAG TPA: ABC transporter permease, partial [Burkholderiaceae bacterium]
MKFVVLWTDVVVWLLLLLTLGYAWLVSRSPALKANWRKVFGDAPALASSVIILLGLMLTLLDSVHYRRALPAAAGTPKNEIAYEP